ncbi:limb region 1 protein homolog isoform X2 [Mya arenaria]|uniref:limb region 1 protein homolog isoform X2 n=1 Tax=Mya arenaria TaxID=6604 RepID=UPI0022E95F0B|nr:limb region 1 protein homolog isoform X2 [Mya arenaria]
MIDDQTEDDEELQKFHNAVREYIIFFLLCILLYVTSYAILSWFKKRTDTEEYVTGEEDACVFRIALWLCTFTLAVSVGAVLLLPISILSNEVLLNHPHSYYVQWLNTSLIHRLWNYVFLFSNTALFVFMPFAYFFTESEGFTGTKGICARVKETLVMLVLLATCVMGLFWSSLAMFGADDHHNKKTLADVWTVYLPMLYSVISFLGVLLLLLCTPVGFFSMFTFMGQLIQRPQFLRDIDEELHTYKLQEGSLRTKLKTQIQNSRDGRVQGTISNGHASQTELENQLQEVEYDIQELEKRRRFSRLHSLLYPFLMLISLGLTVVIVFMVAQNMFQLLVGIKALPVAAKEMSLGITSLSALGWPGSILETVLILYLMSSSVVGFYSLPVFRRITPHQHDTSMLFIILNCSVLLILSSALPVLSRTLGITNFDLVGDFGTMDWLGNFYIIFISNVVFAGATVLCLVNKFTDKVRHSIYLRIMTVISAFIDERRTRNQSASSLNQSYQSN